MSLWTPAEYETAKTMRSKGATNAEIARKIGRSAKAVNQKLALTVPLKKSRPWSPADDAMIRENRAAGWTFRRIAEVLGKPVKTVESRAALIGLRRQVNCDHAARAAASHASLLERIGYAPAKPYGYDASVRAWALSNPLDREAGLILVHLVERGDMTTDDVRAVLPRQPRKSHKSQGASA